jgi:hypothetical protein
MDVGGGGGVLNERDEGAGERREDREEPQWF